MSTSFFSAHLGFSSVGFRAAGKFTSAVHNWTRRGPRLGEWCLAPSQLHAWGWGRPPWLPLLFLVSFPKELLRSLPPALANSRKRIPGPWCLPKAPLQIFSLTVLERQTHWGAGYVTFHFQFWRARAELELEKSLAISCSLSGVVLPCL